MMDVELAELIADVERTVGARRRRFEETVRQEY